MTSNAVESDPNQLRTYLLNTLRPRVATVSLDLIAAACDLAERAHAGQKRDEGTPYVSHPFRVALSLARDFFDATEVSQFAEDFQRDIIISALLHDVLEDAPPGSLPISALNQFGDRVCEAVQNLTRAIGQSKPQYLSGLRRCGSHVRLVKLADRLDNLESVAASPEPDKKTKMAQETLDYVLVLGANSECKLVSRYAVRIASKIRQLDASTGMAAASLAWEVVLAAESRLLEWLPDLRGFLDCANRLNILTSHERLLTFLLIVQAAKQNIDPNDAAFVDEQAHVIGSKIRDTPVTKEERLRLIATEMKGAGTQLQQSDAVAALENFCFQLAFEEETLALDSLLEVLESCIAGPRSDYASSLDNICDAVAKYLGRGLPDDQRRGAGWLIVLPRYMDSESWDTNGAIVGASATLIDRVDEILPNVRTEASRIIPITACGNFDQMRERLVFGYLIACQPTWDANDRRNDQATFAASILGEFIASDIMGL